MTDRELLELAARAAGMVILERPWNDEDGWFFCEHHGQPAMHFRTFGKPYHCSKPWLPLTDDGDALRLAVRLRIAPTFYNDGKTVFSGYCAVTPKYGRGYHDPINEPIGDDPSSAWRRAVVRRAASIGKEMK